MTPERISTKAMTAATATAKAKRPVPIRKDVNGPASDFKADTISPVKKKQATNDTRKKKI